MAEGDQNLFVSLQPISDIYNQYRSVTSHILLILFKIILPDMDMGWARQVFK